MKCFLLVYVLNYWVHFTEPACFIRTKLLNILLSPSFCQVVSENFTNTFWEIMSFQHKSQDSGFCFTYNRLGTAKSLVLLCSNFTSILRVPFSYKSFTHSLLRVHKSKGRTLFVIYVQPSKIKLDRLRNKKLNTFVCIYLLVSM